MGESKHTPIRSCPFCGARAALNAAKEGKSILRNRFWRGWVKCSKCGANSGLHSSPDAAIRTWNRRVFDNAALKQAQGE